jgi:hypothetical protein
LREELKLLYNTHLQFIGHVNVASKNSDPEDTELHLSTRMEARSTDSLNNDTSVINGLEELVMNDERVKKVPPLNRIESERSTLTGSDALIEERPSLEGVDHGYRPFSILPGQVWDCLRSYYGGGPTIPRLICNISSRTVLDRDEIRSNRDAANLPNDAISTIEHQGAWIDINPLSLHLFISDCAGNPLAVPGETIAFRLEGMSSLICRILFNFLRSSEETSPLFPIDDQADESLSMKFLEHCYRDALPLYQLSPSESLLGSIVRVWVLVYHTALDVNLDEPPGGSPMSGRNRSLLSEEPR